jgi:polysaccharide deacetylase family protein (PEP-CTERM system associated)
MKNILTIDVEELFHAEYTRNLRRKGNIFRTPFNMPGILKLLDEHNTKATFFVVGELTEKCPSVMKEIVDRGHEVAFHSYDHKPLWDKNPEQLETEIEMFNKLLTSITGDECIGFRAPSFSLDNKTRWALEVLEKKGMLYDSSVFPNWTPLYGVPSAPLKPYKPSKDDLTFEDIKGKLWEFPLAVYSLLGLRIPAAGGFYLRFATSLVRRAVKKINRLGSPAVIYVHNWELDPETPKLRLNPYKSFITYHNIEKTVGLFRRLLRDFQFTSFAEYMKATGMI